MLCKLTHREFLVRQRFLEEEWNQPSRTDHYLMLLGAEVRRIFAKHPNKVKISDLKLQFGNQRGARVSHSRATQQSELVKAVWRARVGLRDKERHGEHAPNRLNPKQQSTTGERPEKYRKPRRDPPE